MRASAFATGLPHDGSARVVERRAEAADAAIAERELGVFDYELVGDELLSFLFVPGDHARHGLRALVAVTDAHAHVVANPQPLAPLRVIDVELHRANRAQVARLPRPREVALGVASEAAREDV